MNQQEEQLKDTVEAIRVFLPQLIQACSKLERMFYGPITNELWSELGEVVEGIDDLYRTLTSICDETKEYMDIHTGLTIENAINSISEYFQSMNQCVDAKNYVGASDHLKYELQSVFQQLSNCLGPSSIIREQQYEANMSFLKQFYPKVHTHLEAVTVDQQHYRVIYSKHGFPNLLLHEEGHDVLLYSQYDPMNEAQWWADRLASKVESKLNIMIYGLGLGYHLQQYAQAYPNHQLSIYEPDEQILLAGMSAIDLKTLFESCNVTDFVVGENKSLRDRMFFRFLKYMKGDPEIIAISVYDKLKSLDKETFSNDAQYAIVNYYSSLRMYNKYGLEWATNSMNNLAVTLATPSISGMKNKLEGMTAVIVGAGPSLEIDIEYVRELKKHAVIIAAGTTIQSLLHFGVVPHLIVSMDGSEANYNAFKDLSINHIPFLFTPMVKYKIMDEREENLFHVHFTSDVITKGIMALTEKDPIFTTNQSVTGTAIQAAIYMGCTEIVFTGQDLSYPLDQIYASGARHVSDEIKDLTIKSAVLTVENVKGGLNRTNNSLKTTLADIEELLGKNPQIPYVNTSENGAKIKHTVWEPMDKVVARLSNNIAIPDDFLIKQIRDLEGYDERRIRSIRATVYQLPEELKECEQLLRRIDQSIEKVQGLSITHPQKAYQAFLSIDKDWRVVVDSTVFNSLYLMIMRNDLSAFERDLPELANELNLINKSKLIRELMQPLVHKMLEYCPSIMEIVEEAKQRVESRAK
ncbi:motility associated factor glycosyltransferase family protein [Paenibacillus radicis (ex Gao et al. 2016)]|uniref:Motility associated factor glycosyltransferase family protein n=1 Tax=Paenibacillus radicis (ex Gao et al. 2016) TaxID=1737354 RepID=A0A917HMH5_9BACL|nr:6-hydroxymethylpterin diphosphokinase MptE-like protein [Paenibacillus radicis (ex Gao et al. 2016)]GGG84503.1 hypothetical protein GCM10010918_47930 [Paenibacillus radicis (ex Gao et al. 2016)]